MYPTKTSFKKTGFRYVDENGDALCPRRDFRYVDENGDVFVTSPFDVWTFELYFLLICVAKKLIA